MPFTDEEFLPFALAFSQFILPNFKESNLSALYFPFTGDHYKEIIFEMTEEEHVLQFLNIFESLELPLEICWIQDQLQQGQMVTINNPKQTAPCILDPKKADEFRALLRNKYPQIKAPVTTRLTVRLGKVPGRVRYCPFRIIYTRDMAPFYPAGSVRLGYSYEVSENGILKDMVVEGEEIPEGKTVRSNEKDPQQMKKDAAEARKAVRSLMRKHEQPNFPY